MNQHLQNILNTIQQDKNLSEEEKNAIIKSLKDADKEFEITNFKLDRTEKVKRTTAILLEETIEELEQKRKSVEAQNRELEIESSLERVRTVAMSMRKPDDMLDVCKSISQQLELLNVKDLRNVQTAIFDEAKHIYVNYEYYGLHNKTFITEVDYTIHQVQLAFANQMLKGEGSFFTTTLKGTKLNEFIEHQKASPEFVDPILFEAKSLTWYWYSLGPIAFGVSAYSPINEADQEIVKRFRNVFDLSYRRYLDIELAIAQAKEALIETSLERVRAQAMAMRTPEDLTGICEVLYTELHSLGFTEVRNAMINIHDDEKETFVNYDYSDEIGKSINHLVYNIHPVIEKQIKQVRSAGDAFSETYFKGKDLEDWKAFRKEIGEKDDPRIDKAAALYYYFYSIGTGSIGISTFSVIAEEKLNVLKRFRNVFNLSYQRYTDIALAEAQSREAQIELALERVRARTMAMQKSEELSETAQILFQQFKDLGETPLQITIGTFNETETAIELRTTEWGGGGLKTKGSFLVSYDEPTLGSKIYAGLKEQKKSIVVDLAGEELKAWIRYRDAISGVPDTNYLLHQRRVISVGYFSKGVITISTNEPRPQETIQLLERFAGVFDLTYTRFLDLKKAEAQAKEAQIETALERVRSRTMGMQKSEELKEVIQVVYEQFVHLNIRVDHTGFVMDYKARDDYNIWIADNIGAPSQVTIPYFDSVYYNRFNEAKEKGLDFFPSNLSFEEKNSFYRKLFTYVPGLPEESKEFLLNCPGLAASTVLLENVCLYIENFAAIPYSDEENNTLMRFGKVFQQTYTRFLDLQKAEAQAREAKIEAALERTRTQSMIMQHSNELDDTLRVFHEQVLLLGIQSAFSFLWLPDEEKDKHIFWAAWAENVSATQLVDHNSTVFKSKAINYPLDRNEPATAQCLVDWKGTEPIVSYQVPAPGVESYFAAWQELINGVEHLKPKYFSGGLYYVEAFMKYGCFGVIVATDLKNDEKKILGRFATEFERTYRRFLDLQKAEAQAREAKIEAALEKVRSRTMGMQHSHELTEVASLLFLQVQSLEVPMLGCGFNIWEKEERSCTAWLSSEGLLLPPVKIPLTEDPTFIRLNESRQKGEHFYAEEVGGDALRDHYRYLLSVPGFSELFANYVNAGFKAPTFQVNNVVYFSQGNLIFISPTPVPEAWDIFKRFSNVFEQTYTRFLDLQKAEAQSREAQIELGLERVRARAMAMQKSDELSELVDTVFKELTKLDFALTWCIINIIDESSKSNTVWAANPDINKAPESYHMLFEDYPFHHAMMKGWKERKTKDLYVLEGREKEIYDEYLFNETEFRRVPAAAQASSRAMEKYVVTFSFSNFGGLQTVGNVPLSDANLDILTRFGKVFDLTYTRFNDLKQAEAQAKEAKIEAALEKVRSRTMAMQRSDELPEAANNLFLQVQALGIPAWSAGYCIWDEDKQGITLWMSSEGVMQPSAHAPCTEDPSFIHMREAYERDDAFYVEELGGEALVTHYKYMRTLPVVGKILDSIIAAGHALPTFQIFHCVYFSQGFLLFITYETVPESHDIFKRFGKVFDQTYTRFLDLQKAEAQAREAQIEAALEKVRSSSMAMHKSDELLQVIKVVTEQFQQLGFHFDTANFITDYSENGGDWWIATPGVPMLPKMYVPSTGIRLFNNLAEIIQKRLDFYTELLSFEDKNAFFDYAFENTNLKQIPEERKQYLYKTDGIASSSVVSKNVLLSIANYQQAPYTEEENNIIKRIGKVFEQSYTRFLDLQKAEAQARESHIEAALERVRSRTLAMQKSDELAETAAVLFQQLITLGIEPNRLYIAIVKDDNGNTEFWITDEDGSKVSSAFETNLNDNITFKKMFDGWKAEKKSLVIDMHGEELQEYFKYLTSINVPFKGGLNQKRRVQDIAYFSKGFIGMASPDKQPAETLQLLERFAYTFNLTFTRFNDLKVAEAHAIQAEEDLIKLQTEKKRAEVALTELRATQTQLIQSEKMASLGELTAGIAHEIQNPLNFVNNFSEVNTELIEEMKEEIEKGNIEEVKALANDIADNEQKINHHGKRADAIVKGMLQHSRTSTSTKEPTDINKLADEYLRLAYHGLRAKDKSFNATLKTDFDESIGNINIIPQDIGRVILNLITNAFYAAPLPPEGGFKDPGYKHEPTIWISTKKINDTVLISVRDNGPGIPKKILDKIFQPFFTTKPTGQGTGLGLSLSYDIVKAHGGELKVETRENEGTMFTIQLPLN